MGRSSCHVRAGGRLNTRVQDCRVGSAPEFPPSCENEIAGASGCVDSLASESDTRFDIVRIRRRSAQTFDLTTCPFSAANTLARPVRRWLHVPNLVLGIVVDVARSGPAPSGAQSLGRLPEKSLSLEARNALLDVSRLVSPVIFLL